jgi:hypothetical protein
VATSFGFPAGAAGQTILDFEDFPSGTVITTQYGPRGVVFPNGAFLETDPGAHSGTRVLRSGNPTDEFDTGPLVILFTSDQAQVSFLAGQDLGGLSGTLRAFDVNGNLLATDGPKAIPAGSFTTSFAVSSATPSIRRLEFEVGITAFESIDDLTLTGEPPPPPPPAPQVVIEEPDDSEELDTPTVVLLGTVTGEGLFSSARLLVEQGRPPDSTAPPFRSSLAVIGSGTSRVFAESLGGFLGALRITVEAENIGGAAGSDTASVFNLPRAIRDRHAADGGAATFGNLRYAARALCVIAVYEQGAIAAEGATTRTIRGAIFSKWFEERDQGAAFSRLGCPTGDERDAPASSRAQDFSGGRVYAGLPTGTHLVPAVFVAAIETLGGEAVNGVPTGDPTDSTGLMSTWLFQQFTRPDRPALLPSTFEIRGNPPELWVERQAGDLDHAIWGDIPISERSPTLVVRFPCTNFEGPCDVRPPEQQSPISDPAAICHGGTYPLDAREWEPVLGDHVLTPMLGIGRRVRMANYDNPLTHTCFASGPLNLKLYPSDMNVLVRPLYGYRNLFALNTTNIEIEYEYCWFHYGFAAGMEPRVGDLIFVGGRWIIDCGHETYRSEIHPPAVLASMDTVIFEGRPATEADIWINGTYNGAQVDIELYPPPRPSPNALLVVRKPVDAQAALDIDVDTDFVGSMFVRARFSASPRYVPVTGGGEMKDQDGRVYWGRWHVFWSEP